MGEATMYFKKAILLILVLLPLCDCAQAQRINWLSFEQLEDSLSASPKKIFIDFHTDWCTYCRKMDKEVFTKPAVVEAINSQFYAVKMDAETTDSIRFDGRVFINRQAQNQRRGIHELALLLGQRNEQFTPPTMVLLDENFRVVDRHFEYLDSRKLLKFLKGQAK